MNEPSPKAGEANADHSRINLVSGACLGALVGLMLGMSVSETVSGVLMALTALLGAFFGLSDIGVKSDNPMRHYRIIGFSVLCITGIVIGVAVRTSNAFAPAPEAELARWEKIVGREKAVELVTARHFGPATIVPAKDGQATQMAKTRLVGSSVLFSEALADSCGRLDSDVYQDASILVGALKKEEDTRWHQLADRIPPGSDQLLGLKAAIEFACR